MTKVPGFNPDMEPSTLDKYWHALLDVVRSLFMNKIEPVV